MNKKILLSAATLAGFLALTPAVTNASQWHKGTPKALRSAWVSSKSFNGRHSTVKIYAGHVTYKSALLPDPQTVTQIKYKKTSAHHYTVSGKYFNNAPAGGIRETLKLKVISHNKVHVKVPNSAGMGINGYYVR